MHEFSCILCTKHCIYKTNIHMARLEESASYIHSIIYFTTSALNCVEVNSVITPFNEKIPLADTFREHLQDITIPAC